MGQGHPGSASCRRGIFRQARRSHVVAPNCLGRRIAVAGSVALIAIGPAVIGITVCLLGHQALAAALGEFALKCVAEPWIFIGIFDLPFRAIGQSLSLSAELREWPQCKITCRDVASVEVLVIPVLGRN